MMQDPVADRAVRTKTRHDEAFAKHVEDHDEREKKTAKHSHDAQETTHDQPSSSSSLSSSGANREHRQQSNDRVHKQYIDMNNDNNKKQDPTGEWREVTVSRNRETNDDDDRDSKRQGRSSVATHHSKPQHAGDLKCWHHVNGGELSVRELQKARQSEVEYLNKMKVVECLGRSSNTGRAKSPSRSGG